MSSRDAFIEEWRKRGSRPALPGEKLVQPYPGLRSFWPLESDLFFGRERHSKQLLDAMSRRRVIAVLGGSGSGKSSLVRAGVMPRLNTALVEPAAGAWYPVEFRPAEAPSLQLFEAILRQIIGPVLQFSKHSDEDQKSLRYGALKEACDIPDFGPETEPETVRIACRESLRQILFRRGVINIGALVEFAGTRLQKLDKALSRGAQTDPPNIFLLIDQFEEVFGSEVTESDRRMLITLVTQVWQWKPPRVYLFVTMRSEELHRCSENEHLAEVVNGSFYLVDLVSERDLREVIVGPARRVLSSWGLADTAWEPDNEAPYTTDAVRRLREIYRDTVGTALSADRLPLLQHLLTLIWNGAVERWSEGPDQPFSIGIADLEELQGWSSDAAVLSDTLTMRADAELEQAKAAGLAAARDAFELRQRAAPAAHATPGSSSEIGFLRNRRIDPRAATSPPLPIVDMDRLLPAAFCALARRDDRGNPKRDFATVDDMLEASGAAERERSEHGSMELSRVAVNAALEYFRQAGLIEIVREGEEEKFTVSHEALIRSWRRYAEWLQLARDCERSLVDVDQKIRGDEMQGQEAAGYSPKAAWYNLREWVFRNRESRADGIVGVATGKLIDDVLGEFSVFSRSWARKVLGHSPMTPDQIQGDRI